MCIVTRDVDGHLVRLLDARDSQGKTFLEALADVPEEQKRQIRNLLCARAGLPLDPFDAMPIN
jgi:hypothetical protein